MSRLNLLIGECGLTVFSELVKELIDDSIDQSVGDYHVMWRADDITRLTVPLDIRCHVLFMNDLLYEGRGRADFDPTAASLDFKNSLRAATDAPIIAVFACPDDADYPDRLIQARADLLTRAPFETKPLQEALRRLLTRHSA